MADRIIAQADLSGIWNGLRELGAYIDTTNANVITVGKNVDALQQDLDALTADFHDFAQARRLSATAPSAVTAPSPSYICAEERRGAAPPSGALCTVKGAHSSIPRRPDSNIQKRQKWVTERKNCAIL